MHGMHKGGKDKGRQKVRDGRWRKTAAQVRHCNRMKGQYATNRDQRAESATEHANNRRLKVCIHDIHECG